MSDASGPYILIAEDDPFISRMYQVKLSGGGYRVQVASNGREAYEMIKAEQPNLIMLDLNMPEVSGMQLLELLRVEHYDLQSMPVVVLTNSSREEDRAAAAQYGADYLVKADLTPRQVLDYVAGRLTGA